MSFADIVKHGHLYEDATLRTSECIVCDRCYDTNLKSCYSYQAKDLCLKCVEQIKKLESSSTTPVHDVNFNMNKKDKYDIKKLQELHSNPQTKNCNCDAYVTKMESIRFSPRSNPDSWAITLMRLVSYMLYKKRS
jgi:thymidylate kinase